MLQRLYRWQKLRATPWRITNFPIHLCISDTFRPINSPLINIFTTIEPTEDTENEEGALTGKSIGTALDAHRLLGPGLLESTHEAC